ncbi:BRCA1-associated ATM activator 1 isoform X3 [Acanthochromis polyacanthus]|uniref:BRCA1-associated ATM activator 1 isoform X3 n=1 Tax=Acanthochromis polyacanthus TaxID=80966 RepID=UPI002234BDA3|nr:BRCA1-associated ATM activator 1 isoform X3 [Acanthochromis polyacanthus]
MDRECVSLLPRVCEVLAASGSSLPDDTSLEKLLDWFTEVTKAGTSLLESCPCLLEFISSVVRNTTLDPSILSFTLRLTGLVAVTEDAFTVLQQSSVLDLVFNLQHWQEAGLWEDPCIRIGWIQGLRTMMQHPKALGFFVQADFLKPLLQLQTDKSLFVASAANQMLAHVLLSCQSVSSVESNGVDEEGEDVGRSSGSIADLEYPAITVETNQDYAAVVTAISECLKKSLVPRKNSQLHQSLQILKLLALLLAQTRAPLWEKLLQMVADSVDELLAAGYSQLVLPLMDVILAAHSSCDANRRVTDQRVSRLLSFMLNIRKPADLIQAAAAFLRRGRHDLVHTAQSARVLLLPLDIITGLNLLTTTDEQQFSMVEQLKNKTSCISMICVCLTNTPQITLTAADCLPCPPVLIVTAVLSLLRLCSGDFSSSSSSSSSCRDVSRNIIGSSKVQKCALEALIALSGSPGVEVKLPEVVTLLVQYLDNPHSDPTVLHKSYQALVRWMSVCSDLSSITDQHRQDLLQVATKRSCDIRWEVRDSTVEFLGRLAGVSVVQTTAEEVSDASVALLGGCCFTTPLLRAALQDPESYVRASAISALAQTLAASWQQGAALTQEHTEIVNQLLEVLSRDTEGFARRAVVRYFIAWLSSRSSHSSPPPLASSSLLMPSVRSVLSRGSADLDWEVKVHTLELAELLLHEAFSGQRGYMKGNPTQTHPYAVIPDTLHTRTHNEEDVVGELNSLVQWGVVSVLLSGLVDCDRPVALRACRLLMTLREVVCPLSLGALDATAAMAMVAKVTCELPGCGWAREIRKMLATKAKDAERGCSVGEVVDCDDCGEAGQEAASVGGQTPCVSVCEVLRSLDLDERLDVLTRSSDHVHNSPFSLLQDILTASSAHSQPDTQQEVIVDCY